MDGGRWLFMLLLPLLLVPCPAAPGHRHPANRMGTKTAEDLVGCVPLPRARPGLGGAGLRVQTHRAPRTARPQRGVACPWQPARAGGPHLFAMCFSDYQPWPHPAEMQRLKDGGRGRGLPARGARGLGGKKLRLHVLSGLHFKALHKNFL